MAVDTAVKLVQVATDTIAGRVQADVDTTSMLVQVAADIESGVLLTC